MLVVFYWLLMVGTTRILSVHAASPDCFVSLGNWGRATYDVANISVQIQKLVANPGTAICSSVSFLFLLGDNFYDVGVSSATDPLWETVWTDQFRARLPRLPAHAAVGEHDYGGFGDFNLSRVQAQVSYSTVDPLWLFPSVNYTFQQTLSGRRFFFLVADTTSLYYCVHPEIRGCPRADHASWVNATLAEASGDPSNDVLVFVGHHNVLSPVGGKSDPALDRLLVPLLKMHRVSIALMAHSDFAAWALDRTLSQTPYPLGSLAYVTNGAGRGSATVDSCNYPTSYAETQLEGADCFAPAVNSAGGFMLHRVYPADQSATAAIENCFILGTTGAIQGCQAVQVRSAIAPLSTPTPATQAPSSSGSPSLPVYVTPLILVGVVVSAALTTIEWRRRARRRQALQPIEDDWMNSQNQYAPPEQGAELL